MANRKTKRTRERVRDYLVYFVGGARTTVKAHSVRDAKTRVRKSPSFGFGPIRYVEDLKR